jgi:hypothetical protein
LERPRGSGAVLVSGPARQTPAHSGIAPLLDMIKHARCTPRNDVSIRKPEDVVPEYGVSNSVAPQMGARLPFSVVWSSGSRRSDACKGMLTDAPRFGIRTCSLIVGGQRGMAGAGRKTALEKAVVLRRVTFTRARPRPMISPDRMCPLYFDLSVLLEPQ